MRSRRAILALAYLCGGLGGSADAAEAPQRVRTTGVLRCGAVPRPGLFEIGAGGVASGLLAEICRAVAAAQPVDVRVAFQPYDSELAFEEVRQGREDVAFLTGSEIVAERLAGAVVPGPPVYFQTTSVMVAAGSPARSLRDLAGQSICSEDGSSAQRHLEAWFAAAGLSFVRMGYREEGEMIDAFNVQACRAVAGESTALAALRRDGGVNHLTGRILPEPLATFPILAVTPTRDARWSAAVAWVVHTLVRAEVPKRPWTAAGLDALTIEASDLGLAAGWQRRVVAAAGTYADIFRRTLGEGSPYRLARGPNAQAADGGLLVAPYEE